MGPSDLLDRCHLPGRMDRKRPCLSPRDPKDPKDLLDRMGRMDQLRLVHRLDRLDLAVLSALADLVVRLVLLDQTDLKCHSHYLQGRRDPKGLLDPGLPLGRRGLVLPLGRLDLVGLPDRMDQ